MFYSRSPVCQNSVQSFIRHRARVSTQACEDTIFNILGRLLSSSSNSQRGFGIGTQQFWDVVSERVRTVKNGHYGTSADKKVKYSTKRKDHIHDDLTEIKDAEANPF